MNLKKITIFFISLSIGFTTETFAKWSAGHLGNDKDAIEKRSQARQQPTPAARPRATGSRARSALNTPPPRAHAARRGMRSPGNVHSARRGTAGRPAPSSPNKRVSRRASSAGSRKNG